MSRTPKVTSQAAATLKTDFFLTVRGLNASSSVGHSTAKICIMVVVTHLTQLGYFERFFFQALVSIGPPSDACRRNRKEFRPTMFGPPSAREDRQTAVSAAL